MTTYRSGFEKRLHERSLKGAEYEPFALSYVQEKSYIPDFVHKKYLFEAKGYFRTYGEASKYIAVRKANPEYELIFIFSDPSKSMPGAPKRKDGSKLTMGEWASKNAFRFFTEHTIPATLLKG